MTLMTMLAIAAAGAFIFVHEKGMERAKLPLKTLASLCFVALGAAGLWKSGASGYGVMVMIALVLGCVGDVFLQIPGGGDGCFIGGLIAFLLGHLMYIAAFFAKSGFVWVQPVVAAALFIAVFLLLRAVKADFGDKKMLVYAYAAVITVMMGCATAVGMVEGIAAALFVVSDLILALMRYAGRTQKGMSLVNLVTYYAAQILLALSTMI